MPNPIVSRRTLLGGAGAAVVGLSLPSALPTTSAAPANDPRLPMRLLTRLGLPQSTLDRIAAISPQITVINRASGEQYAAELPQADAVFGSVSGEDLSLAKKLRWIQYNAAGVEHVLSSQ